MATLSLYSRVNWFETLHSTHILLSVKTKTLFADVGIIGRKSSLSSDDDDDGEHLLYNNIYTHCEFYTCSR